VLVAAGRVDFDQLTEDAQRHCGHWQPQRVSRNTPASKPHTDFRVIHKQSAMQQYAVLISAGPSAVDEDRYVNRVLATVYGDDSGSRMYWELVDSGRAEAAGSGAYEFQGTGITMSYLSCAPPQTADNLHRIRKIQRDLEQSGITEDELELAVSKICSQIVLSAERPSNRLFTVGNNWIQRRRYRPVKDSVRSYQSVRRADVARVLEKYPLSVNTTVTTGPLTEVAAPTDGNPS
jgi:predicted Zn-dependent peptidase